MKYIEARGRKIGAGFPCFIIAEAGVNHDGEIRCAFQLVDIAKFAGADAVKFQTFQAEKLCTPGAPKAEYQARFAKSQLELLRKLELSPQAFHEIKVYCDQKGIMFLSTPFDEDSADLLNELDVPMFKIASGEITNHGLLAHVGAKQKPVILSTGMSDLKEVEDAVAVLKNAGNENLLLLHCTSNYPAEACDANLRAMETLSKAFNVPVGLSDHTTGIEIAIAAIALGACVIEKHFTIDKALPGPDHGMSLEPQELQQLVQAIRKVETALGTGIKRPSQNELQTRLVARRSIVAAHSIEPGTVIRREMLDVKRPATGISPADMDDVVGRTAGETIGKNQPITRDKLR